MELWRKSIIIMAIMMVYANCQVGRDITFEYLQLDANADYILSPKELESLNLDQTLINYYNLNAFIKQIYPRYFWRQYDFNEDQKIDVEELKSIIKYKWTKHAYLWPKEVNNMLTFLDEQEYLIVCDTNKDNKLDSSQFPACIHAVLTLDWNDYPWKIKSMLYANKNVGYDLVEFKKLVMRGSENDKNLQKYATKLFELLEWDQDKIQDDYDDLIGPDEGKIMESLYILMLLDRNLDGELSYEEALFFLKKFGKEEALAIMDINNDDKVDKNQFISYFCYVSCIDCQAKKSKEVPNPANQKSEQSKNPQKNNNNDQEQL